MQICSVVARLPNMPLEVIHAAQIQVLEFLQGTRPQCWTIVQKHQDLEAAFLMSTGSCTKEPHGLEDSNPGTTSHPLYKCSIFSVLVMCQQPCLQMTSDLLENISFNQHSHERRCRSAGCMLWWVCRWRLCCKVMNVYNTLVSLR